ncbi:GyrI-like domain-containing protein [Parapusillimonas granuli]|uniref:GyrI-like domain-containing protein n=1 Tax=Parapusillimonas granuli TaxID=380911 RepID=A0A853G489_9BURK|nr:GyrI-like domain-containing protein [Parapusillimonas granuli]MBB5215224.1 hypothetical protein [Parapusillimonas granuli]NYT49541.1 GyrI-like domain-containing protein [Parapusillimonas granuli]
MHIHLIEPIPALRRYQRLTIAQIHERAALAFAELHAEAKARDLTINGPSVFQAHHLPSDAHSEFEMTFCLPVASDAIQRLPRLRCASLTYEGPLADLFAKGYQTLLSAISAAGLQTNGESREVYHAWHGPRSPDNRIEIQIGISE